MLSEAAVPHRNPLNQCMYDAITVAYRFMQQQLYVGMYRFLYIHWSVWFWWCSRYDVFAYFSKSLCIKAGTNSRDSPQAGWNRVFLLFDWLLLAAYLRNTTYINGEYRYEEELMLPDTFSLLVIPVIKRKSRTIQVTMLSMLVITLSQKCAACHP